MYPEVEKFYKICIDSYVDGVCITDEKGVIVMSNSSFDDIFGYEKGDLLYQNLRRLIPDKYRDTHINHFMQLLQNSKRFHDGFVYDVYGLHRSGKILLIEIKAKELVVDSERYIKFNITDISIRKEKEREIKRINYGLERAIQKQNDELQNLVNQLQTSNSRLKNEVKQKIRAEKKARESYKKEKEYHFLQSKFLSMASHEFKTPLSGILTSASLIERYNDGKNEKISHHVQKIKKLVNQFNSILDDFLLLEKSETQQIQYRLETIDLCEILEETVKNAQSMLKTGQKIRFEHCDRKILVESDRKILMLIFRNILHNAIKYSPEGKTIDVKVKVNSQIKVRIKDRGIGIPKADRKHIFERFFRARNAVHLQGTGIGLNIVKHHVESLGGSIRFKSKTGKGTTFAVRLPNKPIKNTGEESVTKIKKNP